MPKAASKQRDLTRKEAEDITRKIKSNINEFSRLVYEAHAGRVWLAYGLSSFAEYVTTVLNVSRSRGYQYLAMARIEQEVRGVMVLPEHFQLTDLQKRLLAKTGITQVIEHLTAQSTDDEGANERVLLGLVSALRRAEDEERAATVEKTTPTDTDDAKAEDDAEQTDDATTEDETTDGEQSERSALVRGGEWNHRTVLSAVNMIKNAVDQLPEPADLGEKERALVLKKLQDLLPALENVTAKYVTADTDFEQLLAEWDTAEPAMQAAGEG
ncbi:hypothetical protein ACVLV4_000452 [Rathayibacter agropyri]